MCTEKQANEARKRHAEYLRRSGAHAIAVDEVTRGGKKVFGVIAYYEQPPSKPLPDSLEIAGRGGRIRVPLVVRTAHVGTPE